MSNLTGFENLSGFFYFSIFIFQSRWMIFKAIAGKECPLSRRIGARLQGAKAGA
jgi:hypothetical protein